MVGQLPALISSAIGDGSLVPPGVVYVGLRTPIGSAVIDPFAAAQDPQTQRILQALGIDVTIGLGSPPPELAEEPPLGRNLAILGLLGVGVLLMAFSGRRQRE